jgi:Uri superfamily endonuclease
MKSVDNSGAYRLFIQLARTVTLEVGSLGKQVFPGGVYVYLGSAKRGLQQRVKRHERLAREKQGRCHWHIDHLLLHPASHMLKTELVVGGDECDLSSMLAHQEGTTVPVAGFGATDCKSGCMSHLYLIK